MNKYVSHCNQCKQPLKYYIEDPTGERCQECRDFSIFNETHLKVINELSEQLFDEVSGVELKHIQTPQEILLLAEIKLLTDKNEQLSAALEYSGTELTIVSNKVLTLQHQYDCIKKICAKIGEDNSQAYYELNERDETIDRLKAYLINAEQTAEDLLEAFMDETKIVTYVPT